VRPLSTYRHLYPFDEESLDRIAYYFDFDYEPNNDPTGYAAAVVAFVNDWKSNPEHGVVSSVSRPDGTLMIIDTRSDATVPQLLLSGLEQSAYEFCDELRSGPSIVRHLRNEFPGVEFSDEQVLEFLDSLVQNKLMVTDGTNFLSLAIGAPAVRTVAENKEVSFIPGLPPRSASSYLRAELKVLQV
jgi:hypothetical protein